MNSAGRSPGNWGPPSFFSRKGALTHHRVGTNSISFAPPQAAGLIHSVVPPFPTKSTTLWEPFCGGGIPAASCALRGGLRLAAAASRQCHSTCGGAAVIVCAIGQIPSLQPTLFSNRLRKPATGSFAAEMDGRSARPFSLLRKRNKKTR